MSDLTYKTVQMTGAQMKAVAQPVLDAMNAAQAAGHSLDHVLMATAWVLGVSLAQRGVVLALDAPLREVLLPLVSGYETKRKEKAGGRPDRH